MKLYKIYLPVALVYFFILSQSCTKKNEEELLLENRYCNLDTPSFSADIQPLLIDNCMPCHSTAQAENGVILDNYNEVTNWTTNGMLVGTINHANGFIAMPKSAPKLRDCEISAVEKWVNQGAQNN